MNRFSDLHSIYEPFLCAAPVHVGTLPAQYASTKGSCTSHRPFTTCVFEGFFWARVTGELELAASDDVPPVFLSHAEIAIAEPPLSAAPEHLGEETYVPLFRPGYNIYGHWLIDILPHLGIFTAQFPNAPISVLILEDTPAWADRLLRFFFGDAVTIRRIAPGVFFVGRLFLSTAARDHDHLTAHTVTLGHTDAVAAIAPSADLPQDLYVARRENSSGRVLRNTRQVETMLEHLGFTRVHPEDHSFADQVRMFASARRIVGEAGSGLHNSIFSPADTEVFVIQSASQPHLIQSGLCALKGQRVSYIWAKAESDDWFAPFSVNLQALQLAINPAASEVPSTARQNDLPMFVYDAVTQRLGPIHYIDFFKQIDAHSSPASYFEIGTETGASVAAFSCASVCVDPHFKLSVDAVGRKPSIAFLQMPSDRFFAEYNLKNFLPRGPDVCFLDGMHRYEYLLRDFIAIERLCHARSSVMVHDCLPQNSRMALREHLLGDETESPDTRYGWTGDVWKLIPILKQYRPDLIVHVIDAPPSGIVVIRNLDPSSQQLANNYLKIIEEYRELSMETYGIDRLWGDYPFISAKTLVEHPSEITTFFAHG